MNNDPRTKLNLKYYNFMASYRKAGTCFEYTDKALGEAAINPWMPLSTRFLHYPKTLDSTCKLSRTTQLWSQWPHPVWKLDKNVFGKKNQQEQDHPFSWKSHQGDDDGTSGISFGYQDYTNKCRRISLMTACTPLNYSIGAVYPVTRPAERGMVHSWYIFLKENITNNILFKPAGRGNYCWNPKALYPSNWDVSLRNQRQISQRNHLEEFCNMITRTMSSTPGSLYLKIDLTSFHIPFRYRDHIIKGPATASWVTAPTLNWHFLAKMWQWQWQNVCPLSVLSLQWSLRHMLWNRKRTRVSCEEKNPTK